MKSTTISTPPSDVTVESQHRLLAYSTAASLGAFFAGQSAHAELVQAPGLAPYPHTFLPQPLGSPAGTNHYLSLEVSSKTNFVLMIDPDLLSHPTTRWPSQRVDMPAFGPDTQPLTTLWVDGTTNAYIAAFFGGAIIGNNANTGVPWYGSRLALSYNAGGAFPYINYNWNGFSDYPLEYVGFKFTSSADSRNHFGYMDIQVNFVDASTNVDNTTITKRVLKSVVIKDCRYETTPDAGVTIPKVVKITNISCLDDAVTIDFCPNSTENDDPSVFTVETSPTLGPSANWTADANLVSIEQLTTGTSQKPATYQAHTTRNTGAACQFYRIRK